MTSTASQGNSERPIDLPLAATMNIDCHEQQQQHVPGEIDLDAVVGKARQHIQKDEDDRIADRKDSSCTAGTEYDSSDSTSSVESEHGSDYSATSASVGCDSAFGDTDTIGGLSDKSEDLVSSLPDDHGTLSGWGQSDQFGGDFNAIW